MKGRITYEWVMPHINKSCHVERMSHTSSSCVIHTRHDSFRCGMTHSLVIWHDSFRCGMTYLLMICDMTHLLVIWIFHKWRIHMWQDSSRHIERGGFSVCVLFVCLCVCVCVSVYLYLFLLTHSYVTWRIDMWHDWYICDMTHSYVIWLIHMWCDSFISDVNHSNLT